MDKNEKYDDVKKKLDKTGDSIKKKMGDDTKGRNKIKPIITSRVLFITVLDKIYLAFILITLLVVTYTSFLGPLSSIGYGYWMRVGMYILKLIGVFILYLFMNWLYSCMAKSMICLTDKEVYIEVYKPFVRKEVSIPLNKITKVTTINILWIFRILIINQYGKIPTIFPTWTNQKFKDELDKLILVREERIENDFECKNIIPKKYKKYTKYLFITLFTIVLLVGFLRLFAYTFSSEKKIAGTYEYNSKIIILDNDGTCDITSISSRSSKCSWTYNKKLGNVTLNYEYNSYYSYYTSSDNMSLKYDIKSRELTYDGNIYKKK